MKSNTPYSVVAKDRGVTDAPLAHIVSELKNQLGRRGPLLDAEVAGRAVAMESMGEAAQGQVTDACEHLLSTIRSAVSGLPGYKSLSIAQEQASLVGGVVGQNASAITKYFRRTADANALARHAGDANTRVIGSRDDVGRQIKMEAFDEKENRNAAQYSIAYNLHAARQNEFGEAFFPTTVVTPEQVGFMQSVRVMYVYDEVQRDINGAVNEFNRKNIIKAAIDPTILRSDQTELVPVYRKTNPAAQTDTDKNFYDAAGTTVRVIDTKEVPTAPLKMGAKFSLMGISQRDALLANGQLDQTDAIDSSLRLKNIYVEVSGSVGGTATTDVFRIDVSQQAMSDFNAAPQGNSRLLQINFPAMITLDANSLAIDGAVSPLLSGLATNAIRLTSSISGSVIQDVGTTQLNATALEVVKVADANGNQLGTSSGAGATAAAIFTTAKVVGYDLFAHFTNSNRRQRGQLIDTQYFNFLYTVPLLAPITALRPVGESDVNDANLVSTLIKTTHQLTSNAAVTALLEFQSQLKQYTRMRDRTVDAPEILGVSKHLVSAAYVEDTLDVKAATDSIRSNDRTADIQAVLMNKIRDMAYTLYIQSGYKAALEATHDGQAPKPLLIIGTDPTTLRYLTINGDTRLVGEYMDYKMVETLDERMRGKIVFSFGQETAYNSGVPDPLHFGTMAWKPEMTVMMPTWRKGATAMELTVQPSFRHVVNTPILGALTVTNIGAIVASKATIFTKEQ